MKLVYIQANLLQYAVDAKQEILEQLEVEGLQHFPFQMLMYVADRRSIIQKVNAFRFFWC